MTEEIKTTRTNISTDKTFLTSPLKREYESMDVSVFYSSNTSVQRKGSAGNYPRARGKLTATPGH